MTKYLNVKGSVQKDLIDLLEVVADVLKQASDEVESGLMRCEELSMLVDSLTDYREAPKWIGTVVATLIRIHACSMVTSSPPPTRSKPFALPFPLLSLHPPNHPPTPLSLSTHPTNHPPTPLSPPTQPPTHPPTHPAPFLSPPYPPSSIYRPTTLPFDP